MVDLVYPLTSTSRSRRYSITARPREELLAGLQHRADRQLVHRQHCRVAIRAEFHKLLAEKTINWLVRVCILLLASTTVPAKAKTINDTFSPEVVSSLKEYSYDACRKPSQKDTYQVTIYDDEVLLLPG